MKLIRSCLIVSYTYVTLLKSSINNLSFLCRFHLKLKMIFKDGTSFQIYVTFIWTSCLFHLVHHEFILIANDFLLKIRHIYIYEVGINFMSPSYEIHKQNVQCFSYLYVKYTWSSKPCYRWRHLFNYYQIDFSLLDYAAHATEINKAIHIARDCWATIASNFLHLSVITGDSMHSMKENHILPFTFTVRIF